MDRKAYKAYRKSQKELAKHVISLWKEPQGNIKVLSVEPCSAETEEYKDWIVIYYACEQAVWDLYSLIMPLEVFLGGNEAYEKYLITNQSRPPALYGKQ